MVAALVRGLAPLTAPDDAARDRMRARILAGLGEPDTGDPDAPAGTPADRPAGSPADRATGAVERRAVAPRGLPGARRARASRDRPGTARGTTRPGEAPRPGAGVRGRVAIAAVAMLALVFSLAGMSLLLARDALPGDTLYGIKRTGEAASLGLTFGDEPKALKHLEFAAARVTELETLARRYPNPADAPVGGYLTALSDFDSDAAAGSRQLVALATRTDGRQLESLREWARQQAQRVNAVTARMPDAARNRAGASLAVLAKIATRADALLVRMPCHQITTGSADDVGLLPATGVCERVSGTPGPPTGPNGDRGTQPGTAVTTTPGPGEPAPTTPLPGVPVPSIPALPGPLTPPVLPGTTPGRTGPTVVLPLPLPTIEVPPLLPGLPGVRLGG